MNHLSPKSITVAVTTYKRPDALELVLLGLLNQTRLPDQIIISEDGECDVNKTLIERYSSKFNGRFLHVTQQDAGNRLNAARNRAFHHNTSKFLVLLDGDMIPDKHFTEDYLLWAKPGHFIQARRIRLDQTTTDKATNNKLINFNWLSKGVERRVQGIWSPWLARRLSHTDQKIRHTRGANFGFWQKDIVAINGCDMEYNGWGRNDWDIVQRLYHNGIKRTYLRHAALAYHLEHSKQSRKSLQKNKQRYENVLATGKVRCDFGLEQLDKV